MSWIWKGVLTVGSCPQAFPRLSIRLLPALAVGGKSVVNRPASAGGKACGQLPVDALPRPRRSVLSLFASFSLSFFGIAFE